MSRQAGMQLFRCRVAVIAVVLVGFAGVEAQLGMGGFGKMGGALANANAAAE